MTCLVEYYLRDAEEIQVETHVYGPTCCLLSDFCQRPLYVLIDDQCDDQWKYETFSYLKVMGYADWDVTLVAGASFF